MSIPDHICHMDIVSKAKRSQMMANIRMANTAPESFVRKGLFKKGFRYRCNASDLPGHPDIKLPKHNAVILVHGCYWHGHRCKYFRIPKSNSRFWTNKIQKNRSRDARDVESLMNAGWRVCIVWECAVRLNVRLKNHEMLLDRLEKWLVGKYHFIEFYDASATDYSPAGAKKANSSYRNIGINRSSERFLKEHRNDDK